MDLNYLSEWTRIPGAGGGGGGRKKIDNYFVEVFFKPFILCRGHFRMVHLHEISDLRFFS